MIVNLSAYEILSDENKRRMYDQTGSTDEDMYGMGEENVDPFSVFNEFFRNFSRHGQGRGGKAQDEDMFFSDFESMFTGEQESGNTQRKARGSDIFLGIDLDFMEAVNGSKKKIEFEKKGQCNTCKGNCCKPGTSPSRCSACSGKGYVFFRQGPMNIQMGCQKCNGKGSTIRTPCPTCKGKGIANQKMTEQVNIPKGINTGQNLRVSGRGNTGQNGGQSGDLILKVNVKKDPTFSRDGYDIHSKVNVTVSEAILGAQKKVKTLDGESDVKITAGTEHGYKLRLHGKVYHFDLILGSAKTCPLSRRKG